MSDTFYKYVPHSETKAYEALGWRFASTLGSPHGFYSSLYVWGGEGEPKIPNRHATKEDDHVAAQ